MKNLFSILLLFLSLSAFGQADVVTFEDKDKNIPAPSVRRLVRDVDLNELKAVINQHAALIDAEAAESEQPLDSDLTTLAGLSPSNDDVIQRKSGAWAVRTLAQFLVDLDLNLVDNTSDLGKPVSTAQQTALNLKANLASPTFTGTVSGITKSMVGLSNVDNTTDLGKPISTATQTALNLKTSAGNFLTRVTPTGTVNGVNAVFTVPHTIVDGSDQVYINGVQQEEGVEYGRVGSTFTFAVPPETGDVIKISYIIP